MTEQTEQITKDACGTEKEKKDRFFSLKLLLTVVLAFCTALVFRRSAGVISMTPLAFLICGAGTFIGINRYLKTAVFVLTVFIINTVELPDMNMVLIYSALCLLADVLFEYAAAKIKNRKKIGFAVAVCGPAICIFLSFLLIGNPFTAYQAQKKLNEYTEKVYPESDHAVLGSFEFSRIYYNYRTKAYIADGSSSLYPTETGSLIISGDFIKDDLAQIMKARISDPYLFEITMLLQKEFPNDSFGVEYDGIAGLPGETLFSAAEGELHGSINFIITIGGIRNDGEMLLRTEKYLNVIDKADIGYGRIIFRSGAGSWYRRSITVEGGHFTGKPGLVLERVGTGASSQFNKFVSKTLGFD